MGSSVVGRSARRSLRNGRGGLAREQRALERAARAAELGDWDTVTELCEEVTRTHPRAGVAWWLLGRAAERQGLLAQALHCLSAAHELLPDEVGVLEDLARLARRLDMPQVAETLLNHLLQRRPGHREALNNLGCLLRDQGRYEEAVAVVRSAIQGDPACAMLWNTLGSIVAQEGPLATAVPFFDEAVRLQPDFARAHYNRSNTRLRLGDAAGALEDAEAALALGGDAADLAQSRLARAFALLALGRLEEGWDAYEARLDPRLPQAMTFAVDAPPWTPGAELRGRSLLAVAEQGLGDEVQFAQLVPDLLRAVGRDGRLTVAVEPRLVDLFRRSFPAAEIAPHVTYRKEGRLVRALAQPAAPGAFDAWAPLGSFLREWRRAPEAFQRDRAYLTPPPERVAHWRRRLDAMDGRPKVGVLWKSFSSDPVRQGLYAPFAAWAPLLEQAGVAFVSLQYGDCEAELAALAGAGRSLWRPAGLDPKDDLSDVAALCAALDLVIAPATATLQLAAAVGARCWLVATPGAWTRLGQAEYPWSANVRAFAAEAPGAWSPVFEGIARELAEGEWRLPRR